MIYNIFDIGTKSSITVHNKVGIKELTISVRSLHNTSITTRVTTQQQPSGDGIYQRNNVNNASRRHEKFGSYICIYILIYYCISACGRIAIMDKRAFASTTTITKLLIRLVIRTNTDIYGYLVKKRQTFCIGNHIPRCPSLSGKLRPVVR